MKGAATVSSELVDIRIEFSDELLDHLVQALMRSIVKRCPSVIIWISCVYIQTLKDQMGDLT